MRCLYNSGADVFRHIDHPLTRGRARPDLDAIGARVDLFVYMRYSYLYIHGLG